MTTARDKAVLNMILNPLFPTSNNFLNSADSLVNDEENASKDWIQCLPNFEDCQRLEVDGIKAAEKKHFDEALAQFSQAIHVCSNNPSPYNNRAQVYRLQENLKDAVSDLNKSIELIESMEENSGKRCEQIAKQAYLQRALIHQLNGKNDQAKIDYEKAAVKGSTFAKTQLIALNPYAAMCNKMLHEVMHKLQSNIE